MFCPKCGNEINDIATSCPHCGAEVTIEDKSKPIAKDNLIPTTTVNTVVKTKKKHRVLKTVLLLFLAIAVGFGGYKGWGFVAKRFNFQIAGDEATLDVSTVNVAMAELKDLLNETIDYVNENTIGGVNTNIQQSAKDVYAFYDKFKKIEGLTDNVHDAADEMYILLTSAYRNYSESHAYLDYYMELGTTLDMTQYEGDGADEYDKYISIYEQAAASMTEAYDKIDTVPLFFKFQYELYGDFLNDYNADVAHMREAYNEVSILDMVAGISCGTHIFQECDKYQQYYMDIITDIVYFYDEQRDDAFDIFYELGDVYKMTDVYEIAAYEFTSTNINTVKYKYEPISTIYPSLYNSYRYFLCLELGNISGEKDICIECSIPGLTKDYKETVHIDGTLGVFAIKPEPLEEGYSLTTAREAQMNVTISEADGTLIDAQTFPVHIASKNDFNWQDDEFGYISKDNILCFLTPNSPSIESFKQKSEKVLSEITDGQMTEIISDENVVFNEYLDAYYCAAASMIALSESGVRYNNSGFSIDGGNQNILLPEDVLNNKSGLCIETSLVIASLFVNAGFSTMIILPPGHAQVAIETKDGSGQYLLIETTMIPNTREDFEEYAGYLANMQKPQGIDTNYPVCYLDTMDWVEYVYGQDCHVINCNDAEIYGITPFDN